MELMKHKLLLFFMVLSISTSVVCAQQQTISGKVTDAGDGLSLPGVNIIESGTNNGTVTDVDGNYSLKVASDATLIFSYVGYTTIEVPVNGRSVINIPMEADVTQLAEVVVVGYGVQTKREVTGSIAKVEGEALTEIAVPSFEAALQGKAAGVQVIQGSGTAGSGSMIRVRGIASLSAGGDPLYVVDGIPITQDYFLNDNRGAFNNNPLATINPNDIESVEILKDASAAAIYGSRGANGVILITTKRGKTGKPKFEFSTRLGISKPAREVDLLSSEEWLQLRQEAWENDGNVGLADLPGGITWEQARQTDTDWIDLVTQTGFKQEYNLSMTQGNEKLSSYVGVSYSNNESFLEGNSYERFSGRVNLDYNIMDNLKASLTTSLSQGINNRVSGAWDGGLGAAMSDALPIYPVRNADGTYFTAGNNPVRKQELVDWRTRENRSISTLALTYEPIEKLNLNVSGSLDYMDLQDDQFEPAEWTNTENIAKQYPTWVTNYTMSATASYDYSLGDNNKFTFLVGGEYQRSLTEKWNKIEAFGVSGPLYEDPSIPDRGLDGEGKPLSNPVYETAPDQIWSFISYFGRINYAYKDKLFLKGSARVDGSSRFGQNNRYGFFPSAGLGYVISEEDFFPKSSLVNFLKLKASWGITGNADIPNYQRWGTFQRREGNDGNPYNQEPIIFPVRLENPDLQWEVQRTYDFGFELGLFDDRVVAEVAYFDKNSTDVLIDRLVQVSAGFQRYFENIAEINNRGFEVGLKTRNLTGAFTWTTDINASHLENEVIDIGATPPDAIAGSGDTRVVEGMPVGVNFLNRFSRVDPENGLPIFLDKEGNETYEFNLEDRVPVGSVVPDWTGGITNSFTYKNFDLSVLFTFTIGGNIYDDSGKRQLGVVSDWNMRREIVDRWREPGDVAQFPRLTMEPSTYGGLASFWNLNTTQFLYDGTYGRIRNVTLGYNLPSELVSKLRLRSARVYFNGTNLVTFTKYPGADPEIVRDHNGRQGRNLSPNVTYLTAPQEKAFMLGINVGF
ncbi:TonB-dependent receptor [Fulvivirga kasyanovii]|uniref:TonB-dependent receptor n=2 Tax=Fulvivirga kasyanovii TaxID=396812 RepID=A0ABW9RYT0_9BACT|nr:TonB-dependent receptor [Fulvivirga kasyanovii]